MRNHRIVQSVKADLSQRIAIVLAAWLGSLAAVAAAPQDAGPIQLEYYGYTTHTTSQRAFLRERNKVFVAAEGELILDRYRVVHIGAESAVVEDTSTRSRLTLPLAPRSPKPDSTAIPRIPSAAPSPVPEDQRLPATNLHAAITPAAVPDDAAEAAPAGGDPSKATPRRRHRR